MAERVGEKIFLICVNRLVGLEFLGLAERWWDCENRKVANMANAIGANFERLFCCLDREGVEPTNNRAEQALRRAVQWRKTSFGNRGDAGAAATRAY